MAGDGSAAESGRKARTRRALLDAAGDLFATHGIEETGIEEIALAADVSVGAIYLHFRSKEGLAFAFIESALEAIEREMENAWAAESPLQRLLGAGDAYLRFALEQPVACRYATMRGMLPGAPTPTSAAGKALRARVQRILITVAKDVQLAMDAGELEPAPVDEMIVFLWGAWNGVVTQLVRRDALAIPPELATRALERGRSMLLAAAARRPLGDDERE